MSARLVHIAVLVSVLACSPAWAGTFDYVGTITYSHPAFEPFGLTGAALTGSATFEADPNQIVTDPALITDLSFEMTRIGETEPYVCWNTNEICTMGTLPLTQFVEVAIEFDALAQPAGGILNVIFGAVAIDAWFGFDFDLSNQIFVVYSAVPFDAFSGEGAFSLNPVPLPAASVLLLSALAGLCRRRRRRVA